MTYAFYYDAPGNEQIYRLVSKAIGNERPEGLIAAVVTKTDSGLRHLDVWQSRTAMADLPGRTGATSGRRRSHRSLASRRQPSHRRSTSSTSLTWLLEARDLPQRARRDRTR